MSHKAASTESFKLQLACQRIGLDWAVFYVPTNTV